jgi:hypothetical protein
MYRWDRCVQMGWVWTDRMGVYRWDRCVQMGQVFTYIGGEYLQNTAYIKTGKVIC